MRIMVLGAGGFIGRHILSALTAAGHEIVAVVRDVDHLDMAFPHVHFLPIDLSRATSEALWRSHLDGVSCIVNAAGVLRGPHMDAVHVDMPRALYGAAQQAGVAQVILISAISARVDVATNYAASKLAGEEALRESVLAWTILRPSLVYGDGSYGGTSLIRGLAGLPFFIPLPDRGAFAFTPIHVRDLAQGVAHICGQRSFHGRTLEPVGPDTIDLKALLARYRAWLGFGRARYLAVPMPAMRTIARLGDWFGDGPIATNSLAQLVAGNAGDSTAYSRQIGFAQRSLDGALLARPAEVQDRWHARLFFLAPAIKTVLLLLWLASAWLGLFHGGEATRQLVEAVGLPRGWAEPLRIGSSLADVAVAALLILDRRGRWSTGVQFALVLGYTVIIGAALPQLWLDPLGPLLKNLPILLLIAVHGVIGAKR
jgi:uncharacterized protein YbjT (DUF2867 family)